MPDGTWIDEIDIPRMDTPQDVAAAILDDMAHGRKDATGDRLWAPKPTPRRPHHFSGDAEIRGFLEAWRCGEHLDDQTKSEVREWRAWRLECAHVAGENEARLFTLLGVVSKLRREPDSVSVEIARELSRTVLQGPWGMTAAQVREGTEPGAARMAAREHVGAAPWVG